MLSQPVDDDQPSKLVVAHNKHTIWGGRGIHLILFLYSFDIICFSVRHIIRLLQFFRNNL